jgi:hypothetical protein
MVGNEALRGDIIAALCDPNFIAIASRLTGAFLRQVIANRLQEEGIEVVVVSAVGNGAHPPYREAEIVWQPSNGGEFERQLIRWDLPAWAFASDNEPSGAMHLVVDCTTCLQRNDLTVDAGAANTTIVCRHCGAPLGTPSDYSPRARSTSQTSQP